MKSEYAIQLAMRIVDLLTLLPKRQQFAFRIAPKPFRTPLTGIGNHSFPFI